MIKKRIEEEREGFETAKSECCKESVF